MEGGRRKRTRHEKVELKEIGRRGIWGKEVEKEDRICLELGPGWCSALVNKRQATQPKSESFFEVGGAATSVLHLATDDAHPPPHCYDR